MAKSLEFDQSKKFQRWEWRLQRLGWMLLSTLLVAAALGFLGPGWFSNSTAQTSDGSLSVEYERFPHYHNPAQLRVNIDSENTALWRLQIERSLLDRLEIISIEPEPEGSEVTKDGVVYAFPHAHGIGQVVFHVEFERYGNASGDIELLGVGKVSLEQFVYP